MKTIIIGGGISGLIALYYIKDSILITPEIGGQFNSSILQGPRYLYDVKENRKLLQDLKIKVKKEVVKVGYFYNNNLYHTTTKQLLRRYANITHRKLTPSTMNGGKNYINILDVDINKVISKIYKVCSKRIYFDKVKRIIVDENTIITEKGTTFIYHRLVNTIARDIFEELCGYKSKRKYFRSCYFSHIIFKDDCYNKLFKSCDFIYVIDRKFLFHRLFKNKNDIIVESLGELKNNNLYKVINFKKLDRCKLISQNINKFKRKNILHLGRFASVNPKTKIHHTIEEIRKWIFGN